MAAYRPRIGHATGHGVVKSPDRTCPCQTGGPTRGPAPTGQRSSPTGRLGGGRDPEDDRHAVPVAGLRRRGHFDGHDLGGRPRVRPRHLVDDQVFVARRHGPGQGRPRQPSRPVGPDVFDAFAEDHRHLRGLAVGILDDVPEHGRRPLRLILLPRFRRRPRLRLGERVQEKRDIGPTSRRVHSHRDRDGEIAAGLNSARCWPGDHDGRRQRRRGEVADDVTHAGEGLLADREQPKPGCRRGIPCRPSGRRCTSRPAASGSLVRLPPGISSRSGRELRPEVPQMRGDDVPLLDGVLGVRLGGVDLRTWFNTIPAFGYFTSVPMLNSGTTCLSKSIGRRRESQAVEADDWLARRASRSVAPERRCGTCVPGT